MSSVKLCFGATGVTQKMNHLFILLASNRRIHTHFSLSNLSASFAYGGVL